MRKNQRIEITDPDEISARVSGIRHEIHFITDLGHGNSSGQVIRLNDAELDALIKAVADRRGTPAGEKLALIAQVVIRQANAQNDEDGDKHRADAYLAMEVVESILTGDLDTGAVRTFFPEGVS